MTATRRSRAARSCATALVCLAILGTTAGSALSAGQEASSTSSSDDNSFFQLYLKDGRTLTSYGEPARLGDRVVFSMPTSMSTTPPTLKLIDLPADEIDWPRTDEYTETLRAAHYFATRAAPDYALMTQMVQRWLDDAGLEAAPTGRLPIVERARKVLSEWPATHYGYKAQEIRQLVMALDEIIADLRARLGMQRFDLNLVAVNTTPAAPNVSLIRTPTNKDLVEQLYAAANVAATPSDRRSLLESAMSTLNATQDAPAEWVASTRAVITVAINRERDIDRRYEALRARTIEAVTLRARAADVRGVEQLASLARTQDEQLKRARPDVMAALMASIEDQLDSARRLRLARDQWAIRLPLLQRYQAQMAGSLKQLESIVPALDDIKTLAGSGPDAIGAIIRAAQFAAAAAKVTVPPAGLEGTHAVAVSAAQLAESAATLRRQAALAGNMNQAWNASSAAAGALMLISRFRSELQAAFGQPQLQK